MWTTSNFRAEVPRVVVLLAGLALTGAFACATPLRAPAGPRLAPDAPRPARPAPEAGQTRPGRSEPVTPVELRSATVRRLRGDDLARMAGPRFMAEAREPLVLEVKTEKPLGNLARTSSPLIILNGKALPDTWAISQDTLIAFLSDRGALAREGANTIEVAWLGDEGRTLTRRPLTLRAEDLQ